MTYTLFARAGWGSMLVEAQLAWYGHDGERSHHVTPGGR
jgi:hypothetical protein